jgi:hypothetical protein
VVDAEPATAVVEMKEEAKVRIFYLRITNIILLILLDPDWSMTVTSSLIARFRTCGNPGGHNVSENIQTQNLIKHTYLLRNFSGVFCNISQVKKTRTIQLHNCSQLRIENKVRNYS